MILSGKRRLINSSIGRIVHKSEEGQQGFVLVPSLTHLSIYATFGRGGGGRIELS